MAPNEKCPGKSMQILFTSCLQSYYANYIKVVSHTIATRFLFYNNHMPLVHFAYLLQCCFISNTFLSKRSFGTSGR